MSNTSVSSSLLLYTLIAIERFLSICFPLWHRVNLTKKHIWTSIAVIWSLSVVFSLFYSMLFSQGLNELKNASLMMYILIILFIVIVTIFFISTFVKASLSLHFSSTTSAHQQRNHSYKKQLHLTVVFFVMFSAFAMVYIPVTLIFTVVEYQSTHVYTVLMLTFIQLTSVLNPVLTLAFKKQFRVQQSRPQAKNNRNNVEVQQRSYQAAED